jgi:membrane protein CcdC involved in cytochrome C biogenesis
MESFESKFITLSSELSITDCPKNSTSEFRNNLLFWTRSKKRLFVVRLPLIVWIMSLKATQSGSYSSGESHAVGISLIMAFCLVENPLPEGEEDEYLGVSGEGGNIADTLIK